MRKNRWGCPKCGHNKAIMQAMFEGHVRVSFDHGGIAYVDSTERVRDLDGENEIYEFACSKCGETFEEPISCDAKGRPVPPNMTVQLVFFAKGSSPWSASSSCVSLGTVTHKESEAFVGFDGMNDAKKFLLSYIRGIAESVESVSTRKSRSRPAEKKGR